ncbi:MAG: hypothetical protein AAF349_00300 [Cyanobacteria bacterium P01_A01_bin.68]
MAEPTIQQIFGANATHTDTELVIKKSDLIAAGLTPAANNTAEALFAGIVAHAQITLTDTNQESNPEQSVIIEDSLDSLITRNDSTYRQKTKSISFEKLDTETGFDPDDY